MRPEKRKAGDLSDPEDLRSEVDQSQLVARAPPSAPHRGRTRARASAAAGDEGSASGNAGYSELLSEQFLKDLGASLEKVPSEQHQEVRLALLQTIINFPGKKTENKAAAIIEFFHRFDPRQSSDRREMKQLESEVQPSLPLFPPTAAQKLGGAKYTVETHWDARLFRGIARQGANDPVTDPVALPQDYFQLGSWRYQPTVVEIEQLVPKSTPPLPRFVLDLGPIYVEKPDPVAGYQRSQRSSGFNLVMDVTAPAKALWVVFRYLEPEVKPGVEHPKLVGSVCEFDQDWQPFAAAVGKDFDSAKLFDTVADWKGVNTTAESISAAVALAKRTGRIRKPKILEAAQDEVKDTVIKGWSSS